MSERPLRVEMMGFGRTGRQFYDFASRSEDVEVVAVADIGKSEVLHYLLSAEVDDPGRHRLAGNFLVSPGGRARVMCIDRPEEMPWEALQIDAVVESTGAFRSREQLHHQLPGTHGATTERCLRQSRRHHSHPSSAE